MATLGILTLVFRRGKSALRGMGASERDAIPSLVRLQNDSDKDVARAARGAVKGSQERVKGYSVGSRQSSRGALWDFPVLDQGFLPTVKDWEFR